MAVDALSFSAVDSLIKMNYAQELIDVCDDSNMTPMHIADINFDLHIYDLLIHLGPNKNIKDKKEKTCIDYLRENDDLKYLNNILEMNKLYIFFLNLFFFCFF